VEVTKRIPANVRAAQLDERTTTNLRSLLVLDYHVATKPRDTKRILIDLILAHEGYSLEEIENRGPVALTKLFPL
jgi:hypothetical protein